MNLTQDFWEKTYKENAPKMLGVCRRYIADKAIAEDLMHDAFIQAINKVDTYTGKGCFEAWLRKITVNTALMYLRHKNSKKLNIDLHQMVSDLQNMDEMNTDSFRSVIEQADFSNEELLKAVDSLPEHHKLVFNLYVLDNYTHVQIGKELNISTGTSKSHLARARKKIQQLLYQKALEEIPINKKKKTRAAWLFVISCKSNYIDRLFRGKLHDYSLIPINESMEFFSKVDWNVTSIPLIKASLFTSKILYWVIGSVVGIATITVLLNSYNNAGGSIIPDNDTVQDSILGTTIQKLDTINLDSSYESVIKIGASVKVLDNRKPVVVKKTIIHRKTITIRDTVKIIDTTDVI
jgi:RNA polymerase sigma factor (sigma-70 family)